MSRSAPKKSNDVSLFTVFEDTRSKAAERSASERVPKTVYLHGPNFKKFKDICASNDTSASQVLDGWIAALVESERPKSKSPKG